MELPFSFLTVISVCFSDRFLPDKAIDLIDEAGSRVRLRHAQVCLYYNLVMSDSYLVFFLKLIS